MSGYVRDFANQEWVKDIHKNMRHNDAVERGKKIRRRAFAAALAAPVILYAIGAPIANFMNERREIETAPLVETTNLPSRCYNGEKMRHWMPSYHAYLDRVVEKRNGRYMVPDVDRNGMCVVPKASKE